MRKQFEAIRAARKGNKKGFTLIELLIVVLILGILAGVVMFALGTFTSKSAVAACQTDVKTVQTAVAAYYVTNGSFPTSPADLTGATGATGVGGPYLHSFPSNAPYYVISLEHGRHPARGTGQYLSPLLDILLSRAPTMPVLVTEHKA